MHTNTNSDYLRDSARRSADAVADYHPRPRAYDKDPRPEDLPQHPAFGFVDCPECGGHGGFDIEHPSHDPQRETWLRCERCDGAGRLWDSPRPRDPLLRMRAARRTRKRSSWYWLHRRIAMQPVCIPEVTA